MSDERLARLETKIDGLATRQEVHALIDETKREMRTLEQGLRSEMRALNGDTLHQMRLLHEDVVDKIKASLEPRIAALETAERARQRPRN